MKRFFAVICCIVLVFSLAGCGSKTDTAMNIGVVEDGHITATTKIMTKEQLAERDGVLAGVPEETPVPTVEPSPEPTVEPTLEPMPDVTPDVESGETPDVVEIMPSPEPSLELTPMPVSTGTPDLVDSGNYRYQSFLLSRSGNGNALFSEEAFLTSLNMWSLLTEPENSTIQRYCGGRDYLSVPEKDFRKVVKCAWFDTTLGVSIPGDNKLAPWYLVVDMNNPSSTAQKNSFVSDGTNGFIPYTPTFFDGDTKMDLMSVMYFVDTWKGGPKFADAKSRTFENADGSTTDVVMMREMGLTYWDLGNAQAYCMFFENGDYMMVILPNKGVAMNDVNISRLMSGEYPSKKAHVRFYMPSFSEESMYRLTLSDFNLPLANVNPDLASNVPDSFNPIFTQVVKMCVNYSGCCVDDAGPSSNIPVVDYNDDLDVISIVCDHPFMYYIGDAENEDIIYFGVVNTLSSENSNTVLMDIDADMLESVTEEDTTSEG